MKYRVFGRTGWQVSEIGFGAWQIGGDWGAVDDQQSVHTLLYAYEQGVNFVDTAELYGKRHSQIVIGRSLKEWRGTRFTSRPKRSRSSGRLQTKTIPICADGTHVGICEIMSRHRSNALGFNGSISTSSTAG